MPPLMGCDWEPLLLVLTIGFLLGMWWGGWWPRPKRRK